MKSTAFRADYSSIAAARAVLTETAIAALTATATKKLADEITDKLQLDTIWKFFVFLIYILLFMLHILRFVYTQIKM